MKSKMFPILSSPAKIGNVTLKNRILKAPQSSGMNNKDGTVSERAIRYYSDQAKGGAGAIIVEYAYVDEIGSKSAHCHLGISSDEHIPGRVESRRGQGTTFTLCPEQGREGIQG